MFRRRVLPMMLLALALPGPAPAVADVRGGPNCWLDAANDPTGEVIEDPSTLTGVIGAGPVPVVEQDGEPANYVAITCTVQNNYAYHESPYGSVSRSNTTQGPVGVLADTITFQAHPGDYVYVCTQIAWASAKGTSVAYVDEDPETPGDQCKLATSASSADNLLVEVCSPTADHHDHLPPVLDGPSRLRRL